MAEERFVAVFESAARYHQHYGCFALLEAVGHDERTAQRGRSLTVGERNLLCDVGKRWLRCLRPRFVGLFSVQVEFERAPHLTEYAHDGITLNTPCVTATYCSYHHIYAVVA